MMVPAVFQYLAGSLSIKLAQGQATSVSGAVRVTIRAGNLTGAKDTTEVDLLKAAQYLRTISFSVRAYIC